MNELIKNGINKIAKSARMRVDRNGKLSLVKCVALALLICFLVAVLSAEVFVITQAGHDCVGDGCPVCAQIASVEGVLAQVKAALGGAIFVVPLLFAFALVLWKLISAELRFSTLVAVKARMNN